MRKHRIQCNQVSYNLLEREIEAGVLPYCQEQKITVLAFSPLARGAVLAAPLFGANDALETLSRIARETGRTPAQVALNWCTSQPWVVAIPKSNRVERIEENCRAAGWRLSDGDIRALNEAFQERPSIRA